MGIFDKKKSTEFSLKEFYENPLGRAAHAMQYNVTREQFNTRYDAMYKKGKKVKVYNACVENGHFLLHLLIPSESDRENNYDVVIDFMDGDPFAPALDKYKVRFFSNSPSFTYTYANVYNKEGMLIKEFKDLYEDEVFKKDPKEKNPMHIMNIDKSLFLALIFMVRNKRYMYKSVIKEIAARKSFKDFKEGIRNTSTIMRQIKKEDMRLKMEKEAAKEKERIAKKDIIKSQRAPKKASDGSVIKSGIGYIKGKTSTKKTTHKITPKKSTRRKR